MSEAFGGIDIAVNSAGIVALAPAEDLGLDAWDKTIAINLRGTFLVSQAVGRLMIAAGRGGRIINLASQAGTVAIEEHAAYCASKFGVIGLSKTLAAEWGRHKITVNTISPTIVLTDLGRKAWSGEKGEAAKKRIPSGRFAYPEEIAAAAVFLASERGRDDQRRRSRHRRRLYDHLTASLPADARCSGWPTARTRLSRHDQAS